MSKSVLIAAGHSEKDPGAVNGNYKEQVLATLLRDRVYDFLELAGVKVFRDGKTKGDNLPLSDSIAMARRCDIKVEIHFNAGGKQASGIEALAHPNNRLLAQRLCMAVHGATELKLRGDDNGYKAADSGQHKKLGFCEAGGIVLEVCFISNPKDLQAYIENRFLVAERIASVLRVEAIGR